MKPIWAAQYPACVDDYQEGCSETFIHTLNYTQVSVAAVLAATALLLGRHLQPEAVAEQELPVRWH